MSPPRSGMGYDYDDNLALECESGKGRVLTSLDGEENTMTRSLGKFQRGHTSRRLYL